jgi:hypothetical protein
VFGSHLLVASLVAARAGDLLIGRRLALEQMTESSRTGTVATCAEGHLDRFHIDIDLPRLAALGNDSIYELGELPRELLLDCIRRFFSWVALVGSSAGRSWQI